MTKEMKHIIGIFWFGLCLFITNTASAEMTELGPAQMKATNVAFGFYDYIVEDSRDPFEEEKREVLEAQMAQNAVYLREEAKPAAYVETILVTAESQWANIWPVGTKLTRHVANYTVSDNRTVTWSGPWGSASRGPVSMTRTCGPDGGIFIEVR